MNVDQAIAIAREGIGLPPHIASQSEKEMILRDCQQVANDLLGATNASIDRVKIDLNSGEVRYRLPKGCSHIISIQIEGGDKMSQVPLSEIPEEL